MRLQLRPCIVMAADQESVKVAAIHQCLPRFRKALEVEHHFILFVALAMSCLIAAIAVTASNVRQLSKFQVWFLRNALLTQLKEPRLLLVDQGNTYAPKIGERRNQRLEMETRVDRELRLSQPRSYVQFAPNPMLATGEYHFAPGVISMQALRHCHDPLQIFTQCPVIAIPLRVAHGFPRQIFQQNGFFAVRLVLRRTRLEVKTDGTS